MLKTVAKRKYQADGDRFVIVASKYNTRYVDSMLHAAEAELKRAGVRQVQVIRVPGAYEVPLVAAHLARAASVWHRAAPSGSLSKTQQPALAGIICLGIILRGETVHAAHIGEAVSRALMEIQLQYGVPTVHEVLLLENHQQARARCLDPRRNRGTEAAQTALAMAQVLCRMRRGKRQDV
jgi:6,7-dimethyl-8-ribityllumazine synthase